MTLSEGLQNVLAAHGSKKNRLVVQLTEYEGQRLLNIRRWFVRESTGHWTPTTKGISLTRDGFEFTLKAIRDSERDIHAWFAADDDEHIRLRSDNERQAQRAKDAGFAARPYEVSVDEWDGPEFFRVEGSGRNDVLVLNRKHPVGTSLTAEGRPSDIVALMLLAFGRACRLADGGDDGAAADALELLTANWGFILKRYLSEAQK
jgi:hypothetical protein